MVQRRRIRNLVRNFKENGVKMMLEHSQNVRETLEIVSRDWAARVDFSQLVQDKTTYVRRDFRHVESDMVFQVPLLGRDGRRLRKKLVLYILIEHQSQPEPLMPLRLTDYMLQIFNHQLRQWAKTHNSLTGVRLSPVLPLVLYTGTRRWKSVGSLTDLIDAGHDFRSVTPIIEQPLFLNLPTLDDASLAEGGAFGMVLKLIRDRRVSSSGFRQAVRQVISHLESMPEEERLRWLDLVSYIHAMIYHERSSTEQPKLREIIEESVQTDPNRQEVNSMGKTMAQVWEEQGMVKGEQKGMQQTLLRLIQRRFGETDESLISFVRNTTDVEQLQVWLDRFATCQSIDDLQIDC